MSVQFQKVILENSELQVYVNFHGITDIGVFEKDSLEMHVYAINKLSCKQIFSLKLSYEEISNLYGHISSISIIRESKQISGRFIEITDSGVELLQVINKVDLSLVKALFDKADKDEKLKLIVDALSNSEVENLYASIKYNEYSKELDNLCELLKAEDSANLLDLVKQDSRFENYKAGQQEKVFQNWIEKNLWVLGVDYICKHDVRQIGLGSEADIVMQTTDGYIDLIELKRPTAELLKYDESHKSYYPSVDLAKVIGQCVLYLKKLDDYRLQLEDENQFQVLKPRVKIIIGRSMNFKKQEKDALRLINSSLNHIQIMTYDYLYSCGENILNYYSNPTTI